MFGRRVGHFCSDYNIRFFEKMYSSVCPAATHYICIILYFVWKGFYFYFGFFIHWREREREREREGGRKSSTQKIKETTMWGLSNWTAVKQKKCPEEWAKLHLNISALTC